MAGSRSSSWQRDGAIALRGIESRGAAIESPAMVRPCGDAVWQSRRTAAASRHPLIIRLLPGGDGTSSHSGMQAVYYYPPERPLLRVQRGRPVLTLTLVLSRRPAADEESIHPLIERGILAFDVELAAPPAALAELQRARPAEYRALFLRDSAIRLRAESGEILSTVAVSGTDARGALSATLDREQALGALAAIDGGASGLTLETSVGFNASELDTTDRLRGSMANLHKWC